MLADSLLDWCSLLNYQPIEDSRSELNFKRGRPSLVVPLFLFAVAYATLRTNEHNEEVQGQDSAGNSSVCGRLVRLRKNQGIRILLCLVETVPDVICAGFQQPLSEQRERRLIMSKLS